MGKLNDKEVEEINRIYEIWDNCDHSVNITRQLIMCIQDALNIGEVEPRFGEWISVDNPPKVERYETLDILVTDGESITNGYATLDPFDDDSDEVEIHGRFPIDNKNIKWWMPLPKLPKEVKE